MKQAMYYEKTEDSKVRCYLCPHNCVIKPGGLGVCRARKNVDGDLYSLNYGKITSIALDPIEKKPLYRFHPGKEILSVGTFGCNFKCSFCQNWRIAHEDARTADITPEQLAGKAEELTAAGNIGIAYTYNEPSIWYEFVYETAKIARAKKLENVLVTNGFISREPLENLLPYIDAMNIDVKAFTDKFYKDICKGALEHVKETVEIAAAKCHVEVTTLVIPVLVFGLPITDTFYAMWRRFRNNKPIFQADNGHIHHRLLNVGLTTRQTVMVLYTCSIYFGAAAILFHYFSGIGSYILLVIFALFLLGVKHLDNLSSILTAVNGSHYSGKAEKQHKDYNQGL